MNFITEIFNFDDIGKKIKNLVKWSCWITIFLMWIAAPITFFALLFDEWTVYYCWIPLVSAIFGPIFIWISCWGLYAFGELVDNATEATNHKKSEKVKNKTPQTNNKPSIKTSSQKNSTEIQNKQTENVDSDENFVDVDCPKCGETISVLADQTKIVCPWCNTKVDIKL